VDFSRFLYISLAFASEVKSMLYLAQRLGFIDVNQKEGLLKNNRYIKNNNRTHKSSRKLKTPTNCPLSTAHCPQIKIL